MVALELDKTNQQKVRSLREGTRIKDCHVCLLWNHIKNWSRSNNKHMQKIWCIPCSLCMFFHMNFAHFLLFFQYIVFLVSSIHSWFYTLSSSFFIKFPKLWEEVFDGDIIFKAACSKVSPYSWVVLIWCRRKLLRC